VIVRRWTARLESSNVEKYLEHLDGSVKPALAALPGFVDSMILERRLKSVDRPMSEVVVETRWASLDAVRAFAGADVSVAVVEPAAAALFSDYDRHVVHYDVIG
jgi:heme-degrading monooxygenase HmoA